MATKQPYRGPAGTGFVSLKRYLELNPEAAQRMGTQLTSDVEKAGQGVQNRIGNALGDFKQKVEEGSTAYTYGTPSTSEEATARAADAVYKGPKALADVADYSALDTAAGDVDTRAQALTSDAGRGTLLAQQYGRNGGYTPGASMLDAFLAGRGGGQAMEAAAQKWGGMRKALGLADTEAKSLAQGTAGLAAQTQARYLSDAERLKKAEADAKERARLNAARKTADARAKAPSYRADSQVTPGGKGGGTAGRGTLVTDEYGDRVYQDAPEFRPARRKP